MFSLAESLAGNYMDKGDIPAQALAGAAAGLVYRSTAGPRRALLAAGLGATGMGVYASTSHITGLHL